MLMCGLIIISCIAISAKLFSSITVTEIDLTWSIDKNAGHWYRSSSANPDHVVDDNDSKLIPTSDFYISDHAGTFLEAPKLFNENGWYVGEIPLSKLIAPGIMIDISLESDFLKDNTLLLPRHIKHWVESHGSIPNNCILLVRFGWSRYQNKMMYMSMHDRNTYKFPGISMEAIRDIVAISKIVGIGVDTPSVDPGNSSNLNIHKLLAHHQIYVMENLCIPTALPEAGFDLYVMPLKIKGTRAPVRVIAILKGSEFSRHVSEIVPYLGHFIFVCSIILLCIIAELNEME